MSLFSGLAGSHSLPDNVPRVPFHLQGQMLPPIDYFQITYHVTHLVAVFVNDKITGRDLTMFLLPQIPCVWNPAILRCSGIFDFNPPPPLASPWRHPFLALSISHSFGRTIVSNRDRPDRFVSPCGSSANLARLESCLCRSSSRIKVNAFVPRLQSFLKSCFYAASHQSFVLNPLPPTR